MGGGSFGLMLMASVRNRKVESNHDAKGFHIEYHHSVHGGVSLLTPPPKKTLWITGCLVLILPGMCLTGERKGRVEMGFQRCIMHDIQWMRLGAIEHRLNKLDLTFHLPNLVA